MVKFRLIPQIIRCISKFKNPFSLSGAIPILILKISVIRFCRYRWCKVVELSLLNSSSKDESNYLNTTSKALSSRLLMRTFSFRPWNIHTTRKFEKWQITKALILSLYCSKLIDDTSLDKASIFWLSFYTEIQGVLYKDSVCSFPKTFSVFTTDNCFISVFDFIGVLTKKKKLIFTRISSHTVVVKSMQKCFLKL